MQRFFTRAPVIPWCASCGGACVLCLVLASCSASNVRPLNETEPAAAGRQVVETQIGAEEHRAVRQLLGGDFTHDPALLVYVRVLGEKLASRADTGLSYAFSIVDNSHPNAWALPGGHIIVSRGLLQKLECESQLAAVLALQIARALQDRSATLEQSEFVSQAARAATQADAPENPFAALVVGDGALAANLLAEQKSATDEHAAEQRAMRYLEQAHYDPAAVAHVKQVLMSPAARHGVEKMGADAPTSRAASSGPVQSSDKRLARTSKGEMRACAVYKAATQSIRKLASAYGAYDAGVTALKQHDLATASSEAAKALALAPDQSKFHGLLGDIALAHGQLSEALSHFRRAIDLDADYFEPYVSAGIVAHQRGDREAAAKWLDRSMALLPTASAALHLARISQDSGNLTQAIQYYQLAAASDSAVGRDAARELVVLDLPRNPGRYVRAEPKMDPSTGEVWMEVRNQAPVAVDRIVVAAALAKREGGVAEGPVEVHTGSASLAPGTTTRIATPLGPLTTSDSLDLVRTQVEAAEVAETPPTRSTDRHLR